MKKTFLPVCLLFAVFASANTKEIEDVFLKENVTLECKVVNQLENENIIEAEDQWCHTVRSRWYRDSFTGLDGKSYDRYDIVDTTYCY
jgi:hypothetical protein